MTGVPLLILDWSTILLVKQVVFPPCWPETGPVGRVDCPGTRWEGSCHPIGRLSGLGAALQEGRVPGDQVGGQVNSPGTMRRPQGPQGPPGMLRRPQGCSGDHRGCSGNLKGCSGGLRGPSWGLRASIAASVSTLLQCAVQRGGGLKRTSWGWRAQRNNLYMTLYMAGIYG